MDLERLSHRNYRTSVIVAIVLSGLFVTVAALIGRGTLNLRSSLLLPEPTDVTVIAVVEPKLGEEISITNIEFLRKENMSNEEGVKPNYSYLVQTSDDVQHLVRLGWKQDTGAWSIITYEDLHGRVTNDMQNETQDTEKPEQQ